MDLKYLKYDEIDLYKWDHCIKQAVNGNINGFSWYLNIICDNWSALVETDYKSVMPLPEIKSWGSKKVFVPNFANQLGIFSNEHLHANKVDAFIKAIPANYTSGTIGLNNHNKINSTKGIYLKENENMLLDLIQPYEKIAAAYSDETSEHLRTAHKEQLTILEGVNNHEFLSLIRMRQKETGSTLNEYDILRKLIAVSTKYRLGKIIGVYSAHNSLVAAAFFITALKRSTLISMTSLSYGMDNGAQHFLIDNFIRNHCERNMSLDFNGSNDVYKQFGAKLSTYQSVTINRRRWPFSLLNNLQ